MFKPNKDQTSLERAQLLAIRALRFLSEDEDRLNTFLTQSGLGIENLRLAAESEHFLAAVLDYICSDEALLESLSTETQLSPQDFFTASQYFHRDEF